MPSEHDRERLGARLRDAYRDVVPTPDQRQRHLTSINNTLPGMAPVPWRRQRGLYEAIVVITILALVVGGFAFWESRGESSDVDGTAVPAVGGQPTRTVTQPTATMIVSDCQASPTDPEAAMRFASDPLFKDWYSEGDLAISPVSINRINPTVPESQWKWFTGGIPVAGDWPFQAGDTFTITAERLDGPAEPVNQTQTDDTMINSLVVMFPEPGCWELTASVRDMSLTIVVDVRPITERPDVRQAIERRDSVMPYPAPESCGPGWDGPVDRTGTYTPNHMPVGFYSPAYWIDLEGLSVRSYDGILWTNEPASLSWIPAEWGDELSIKGRALDGGMALGYASDLMQRVGAIEGNFWDSALIFGTPGCWELTVELGETTQTFMVWVYPADCRRVEGESLPDACQRPE